MNKLLITAALLVLASAASARPGGAGAGAGAASGAPHNDFGQATSAAARSHTLSGATQSAAARAKGDEKRDDKRAEHPPAGGKGPKADAPSQ